MPATDPLIGTRIGKYQLVSRLGSGGMGDVYSAVHREVGARVAIKILHATSAGDPEGAGRFQIEAQAGNQIEHPGVIKVLDAGQLRDGRPYMVMPLLDGRSLADELVATPRLPIAEACRIAIDVLDAMDTAHARGFVHRDLKPPNLFLTSDRRVVILDFGVAKLMAGDSPARLTRTGTAIGTPYYMAPEQIREHGVGPASDVYAIGVVLFEMLCGRLPFDGPSAFEVMAGHLEKRPPPPRALRPEIPVPIADIVLVALAKEPARRFKHATAMRNALRAALVSPVAATAEGAPPPGPHVAADTPARTAPAPDRGLVRLVPWAIAAAAVVVAIVIATRRDPAPSGAPAIAPATSPSPAPIDAAAALATAPPDAAPAPTPPPVTGRATLTIDSRPDGATASVDGGDVGPTPITVEISPGDHRIEVRRRGYRSATQSVEIEGGGTASVELRLSRVAPSAGEERLPPGGIKDPWKKQNPYASPRPDPD